MDLDPDRHPFGGEWYGEYPDSELESEDPEVDLEPEPASGSGKVRSCELQRGKEQEEDLPEDQPVGLPADYQFLYQGEVKRTSYYLDPKFTHLNYLRNFQSSTSNLNNSFLENPYLLNPCKVKNKEAETYPNYTTENYLRYKMERKMKEAEEKKEEAGKEDEVKEGGEERRKRGNKERKKKK